MKTDEPPLTLMDKVLVSLSLFLSFTIVLWSGFIWGQEPEKEGWIKWMILFSASVLMPLAERLISKRPPYTTHVGQGAITFGIIASLVRPAGAEAAMLACGWLLMTIGYAAVALWQARPFRELRLAQVCLLAARVFPVIGAAWLVAHRAGWAPWGFNPLIVLLTAAHFHHAGFTLPLIAGLNAQADPCRWNVRSCYAILAGVPLVAVGITGTHFGIAPWIEPVGVVVLVAGALGVATAQLRHGLDESLSGWLRLGFVISGASLFLAMLMALGFGLRLLNPAWALPMPQMWAIHGSLNAFGFGLCGVLSWRAVQARASA